MVNSALSGIWSSFARRGRSIPNSIVFSSERSVFVIEKARSFARRGRLAKANLNYLSWQSFLAPGRLDFTIYALSGAFCCPPPIQRCNVYKSITNNQTVFQFTFLHKRSVNNTGELHGFLTQKLPVADVYKCRNYRLLYIPALEGGQIRRD